MVMLLLMGDSGRLRKLRYVVIVAVRGGGVGARFGWGDKNRSAAELSGWPLELGTGTRAY